VAALMEVSATKTAPLAKVSRQCRFWGLEKTSGSY